MPKPFGRLADTPEYRELSEILSLPDYSPMMQFHIQVGEIRREAPLSVHLRAFECVL
jgi:hypothetical protein